MKKDDQGQVEKVLKELGQKIDELIGEAKGATGELREDLESKIRDFKEKKWQLDEEYQDFKNKNEGKWDDIKTHLSNAARELEKAARAALKGKDS